MNFKIVYFRTHWRVYMPDGGSYAYGLDEVEHVVLSSSDKMRAVSGHPVWISA